jgi:hypothetical protein
MASCHPRTYFSAKGKILDSTQLDVNQANFFSTKWSSLDLYQLSFRDFLCQYRLFFERMPIVRWNDRWFISRPFKTIHPREDDLLNEVSHLRISLISCHYPWFSPGSWDLLKRMTFMRTFPYLSVSSASPSEELPHASTLNVSDRQIQKCHP